jgi:hypothetical protein
MEDTKTELKEHNKKQEEGGSWTRLDVIKVKPGRYKATGRHHFVRDSDYELFSEIIRVGDVK